MKNVLIVLTSHDTLGDTGQSTGFFYEELATPYYALWDAGHRITLASIAGGPAPHDPNSLDDEPSERPVSVARFIEDSTAMAKVANTIPVADLQAADYDAIFLPGGHGTVFDMPDNAVLAEIVGNIHDKGGIVAAVCHGPAGLLGAKRADGKPLVEGRRVNSFTNAEEEAMELSDVVPLLLETRFRELGANFEAADNFTEHAVRDDRLITGQNPMSSDAVARHLVDALG